MKKVTNDLKFFVQRKKRSEMFQCEIFLSPCPSKVFSKITSHFAQRWINFKFNLRLKKPKNFLIKIFKPKINQMSFLSEKNVPNQVNSKKTWLKRARTLLKDRSMESFFQSPQENVCECTLHSQQYQSVKLHTENGKKNYGGMFENIWKASNRTANTTDIVAPLYVSFL